MQTCFHRAAPIALAALCAALAAGCGETPSRASAVATAVPALHSRTDLRPPRVSIAKRSDAVAPGLVFIGPKAVFGAKKPPRAQYGPMIIDDRGRVRWFSPMPSRTTATDVRVQEYKGRPVLTYWKGRAVNGQGDGTCVILDESYREIAEVGVDVDLHDCELTPDGTLLALSYVNVRRDLRSVGGDRDDSVVDGRIEEYDIETGRKLWTWSSLKHVSIKESYEETRKRYNGHWDYFHINSVAIDTDGNLLVSARHTWAVYKINRRSGKVMWRLGGKRSTFPIPREARFAWQHDARPLRKNVLTIFDNDAGSEKVGDHSQVITVAVDPKAKRARLVRSLEHPSGLSAGTQGNARVLDNGDTFVGWGSQGRFSEFDPDGMMIFDGRVPRGMDSYRAYRSPWTGTPTERPSVAARADGERTTVYASYNGSTDVASWRVLAGASADALRPVTTAPWSNLETRIDASSSGPYFAVEALAQDGTVLATSTTTRR